MAEHLTADEVAKIATLLAEGHGVRLVARLVGRGRATVGRILAGRQSIQVRRPRPVEESSLSRRPIGRCPTCGRRVRLPCHACRTDQAAQRNGWVSGVADFPLVGLDLRPAERARYDQVRAAREALRRSGAPVPDPVDLLLPDHETALALGDISQEMADGV